MKIPDLKWNAGVLTRMLYFFRLNDCLAIEETKANIARTNISVTKEHTELEKIREEVISLTKHNETLTHEVELLRLEVVTKDKSVSKILEDI